MTEDVSRETHDMLRAYSDLLVTWTRKINLIAPSTVSQVWERHILDSLDAIKKPSEVSGRWVDLGSGGGLPGMVAAIVYRDRLDSCVLVESDQRKCVFLRSVVRELELPVQIMGNRIEDSNLGNPDIVSARALASLSKLLDYTSDYHAGKSRYLFMKGRAWRDEVAEARSRYRFALEVFPSVTDTGSTTLLLSNVQRHLNNG